jgi:hypothetical protein
MSEFEYDSYDISAIKVSFENLRRAERQGFWAGLLIGSPLAYYISINKQVAKKCTMSRWTVGLSGLVLGSLMYFLNVVDMELIFSKQDKVIMMLLQELIVNILCLSTRLSPIDYSKRY